MSILVLVPAGTVPGALPTGCDVVTYADGDDVARALAGPFDAAIILSDGLPGANLAIVAAAVSSCGRPVIEVRSEHWDGATHSPLSAACRGVISGFGLAGIGEAIRALVPA